MASYSIATDKGHSSKYPTLSVAMHKSTDEYIGGYKIGFFLLLNFTILKLNVKELNLYLKLR